MVEREVNNIYEMAKANQTDNSMTQIAACKKCGHLGHLTTQCMNIIKTKDGKERILTTMNVDDELDIEKIQHDVDKNEKMLEKLRKAIKKNKDKKKLKKKLKKKMNKDEKKKHKKKASSSSDNSSSSD